MKNKNKLPLIFDLRSFTLDDGPGIRTTVFLKGCPLSCVWCHNPEAFSPEKEIAFYAHLCLGCGDCERACSESAISIELKGRIDREKCTGCGVCADACPTTAIRLIGMYYPVSDLVEKLLSDRIFYKTSKGGVTFSGGEPTLFMDYVSQVMKGLKDEKIHIAIQTSGQFDLDEFKKKLLPYIDLIFYDIKLFDSKEHEKYTGRSNDRIISNFISLLNESDVPIVPRIPLIPKITENRKNLKSIEVFLKSLGCIDSKGLTYNPGGNMKRNALGR